MVGDLEQVYVQHGFRHNDSQHNISTHLTPNRLSSLVCSWRLRRGVSKHNDSQHNIPHTPYLTRFSKTLSSLGVCWSLGRERVVCTRFPAQRFPGTPLQKHFQALVCPHTVHSTTILNTQSPHTLPQTRFSSLRVGDVSWEGVSLHDSLYTVPQHNIPHLFLEHSSPKRFRTWWFAEVTAKVLEEEGCCRHTIPSTRFPTHNLPATLHLQPILPFLFLLFHFFKTS